jgi:hypothetical protein
MIVAAGWVLPVKKSELATVLDSLQAKLRPFFKDRGFRIRRRTLNRTTPDGLTDVVNFQMGSFDPPGTTYIPGLRENLYGRFTINLGIYVPEVARYHGAGEARAFVQDYFCCLRERLGQLGPDHQELWWRIRDDYQLADELRKRLERDAFPFFSRFETRDALLSELLHATDRTFVGSPPRIICAIILAVRGCQEDARALLATQIRDDQSHPQHAEYVRALAGRLGLPTLDT